MKWLSQKWDDLIKDEINKSKMRWFNQRLNQRWDDWIKDATWMNQRWDDWIKEVMTTSKMWWPNQIKDESKMIQIKD